MKRGIRKPGKKEKKEHCACRSYENYFTALLFFFHNGLIASYNFLCNTVNEGVYMDKLTQDKLIAAAREAASFSYSPYSRFRVGAALLCGDGTIVTGANIENSSYGLTIVPNGRRSLQPFPRAKALSALWQSMGPIPLIPCPPCGACRQVISEFVSSDFPVIFSGNSGEHTIVKFSELFPFGNLKEQIIREISETKPTDRIYFFLLESAFRASDSSFAFHTSIFRFTDSLSSASPMMIYIRLRADK